MYTSTCSLPDLPEKKKRHALYHNFPTIVFFSVYGVVHGSMVPNGPHDSRTWWNLKEGKWGSSISRPHHSFPSIYGSGGFGGLL